MTSAEQVFFECLTLSWRASWLILLLLVLRLPLRRLAGPRWCFALWLVVAVALIIPMRAPLSISQLRPDQAFPLPAAAAEPAILPQTKSRTDAPAPAASRMEASPAGESPIEDAGAAEPPTTDEVSVVREAWASVLALLWLGGMVGLLGLRLIAAVRLQRRLTRERSATTDTTIEAAVKAACVELGVRTPPDIITTPLVNSPALCGVLRPRLLFPLGFAEQLTPEALRWVVRHELGHLRRRDLLVHSLLQLACAIHWFNPLVWFAARLARQDGEMACDDFVLRHAHPSDPAAYGRALLSVLGAVRDQSRLSATLSIVENKRQLLTRISMISSHRPQTLRRTLTGAALLAVFAVVGYTEEPKASSAGSAPAGKAPAFPRMTEAEMIASRQAHIAELDRWAAEAKVVLRAIGTPGGVPVALFDVNDEPWIVQQGSELVRSSVTTIDVQNGRVTISSPRGRSEQIYELKEPRQVKFPEFTPQQIESLLSPENLKKGRPFIPSEVRQAWSVINREGKEAILLNYLKSGYLVGIRTGTHMTSGTIGFLFNKQLVQRFRDRYQTFVASLSPEQREAFSGGTQAMIPLDAPDEKKKAFATQSRTQMERREAVIASLTPEQRKLYDAWIASGQR